MLQYNIQFCYNCEKNPSNPEQYKYTGAFYYAEDGIPKFGNQYTIFAKDHSEMLKELEERLYFYFCIDDELAQGHTDYRIFINDYCLSHKL